MKTLVQLKDINMIFPISMKRKLGALNSVNLSINKGEILGVAGESGCGKSTLAKIIMGILIPTSGEIIYQGEKLDLSKLKNRREFSKKAQIIFQNPYSSLNPRLNVANIILEGIKIHKSMNSEEQKERLSELLKMVGLDDEHGMRYPNEFSGGQRQRIGIARALAMNTELLICDEPISALDSLIQAQIVNLLKQLHRELDLTIVFIAHDLNMIRHLSDRIVILYLGHIVELSETEDLYKLPKHPYTRMLLDCVLTPNINENKLLKDEDEFYELSSPILPIVGCPFVNRCKRTVKQCNMCMPEFVEISKGHYVACHNPID